VVKRAVTTCVFVGSLVVAAYAADVLAQLGITPQAAKEAVDSVINSGVYNPGLPAGAFRLLPPPARAEAAAAGVAWLKTYAASPEFRQQYAQIRETHKPAPPSFTGTPEDELKKADEEQKQQAEESMKALASLPAAQRAQIEEAMKAAQAMTAQMNTPEMRKLRLDAIKAQRTERTTQYEQELATWNRTYPETAAPLVAKRLREFLAASADVDFTAKLVAREGRMAFENPAYEQKPGQWKMCFRAGREATAAARAGVQAWLKELGG
jgi:hypothetical protein